jgi:methionine synthase I (cobalamin-dependent)
MYTLKVESVNNEFLQAVQAMIQENTYCSYEIGMGKYDTTISISTMNIKELKRIVDLIESEQFMKEDFNEYLSRKFDN